MLLRGINVGGNTRVEMARLRQLIESLGYTDVVTYINSGNIILTSSAQDTQAITGSIETAIETEFGYKVPVLVLNEQRFMMISQSIHPNWQNNAEQKTDVLFLWKAYDSAESLQILRPTPEVDELVYVPGAVIWHIDRVHYNKSAMRTLIETVLYKHMTARNCNTVRKLATLLQT